MKPLQQKADQVQGKNEWLFSECRFIWKLKLEIVSKEIKHSEKYFESGESNRRT